MYITCKCYVFILGDHIWNVRGMSLISADIPYIKSKIKVKQIYEK